MSASREEIQELADKILELMTIRITSGQMILHFHEGKLQRVETNNVHRLTQDRAPVDRRRRTEPLTTTG